MTTDRIMKPSTIAVLEPGYAAYMTEQDVLADDNVHLVPVGEDVDAVQEVTALDPVALMVRERAVTAPLMEACPNLRVVVRYGVGVDSIDLAHATKHGIYVANVPDYGAEIEVSEHAVALYLAVQRRLVTRDFEVRSGLWGMGQAAIIPDRTDAILGLVGGGRIGLETARKFRALGFAKVMVTDPFLSQAAAQASGLELAGLADICRSADVISLHAPLTEQTHHIIDSAHIALMKPTTILVNVARGGLLDEGALARALHEGRIFGAGIDVFEQEPIAATNPLFSSPNTIISDHTAWYSERTVKVLQRNAALEVQRVLRGAVPENWVNCW
jgi:D-3-phosphoglycerate dehydrogenase